MQMRLEKKIRVVRETIAFFLSSFFIREKEDCCSDAWESELGLGVFDFPWLKDGVRCKSEEYFLDLKDNFSSLLEEEDASWKGNSSVDLLKVYDLFESPEEKLEHIAWQPFEIYINGVRCKIFNILISLSPSHSSSFSSSLFPL
ncbi:hypothetical protein VIGAN_05184100 [Vigna angularis var. angularis]|uniref:Uncharacterized protein n=1 Tax=Vigna angularis var. angularis TaxID=157739 RepID=A0A0S3S6C2_PHAAN|nr:hypothetical protein VIGAN_05184100 [Vigna angularis var. angularis]